MKIIDRIKRSLERGYYCDCCCDKKHWQYQPSILGLVGAYIGIATSLSGLDGIDEKKYCVMCHP